jgi:hypothetical protein
MPGVDDASFAFRRNNDVAGGRYNVPETRLGKDNDLPADCVTVRSAVAGLAGRCDENELPATEPFGKRKLLAVLAIRMSVHFASIFGSEQMHRIGDYHGPFIQMVLQVAVSLASPL